ncbi:MAG: hypothetical protein SGI92_05060 [Bryobacteraceae bacterium]|nr:hypothetical protein [Bryobacteraceae bacterium]
MNDPRPLKTRDQARDGNGSALHPAWRTFIEYCSQLGYGEIERLTIQDGLPVLAERTKQKVKFTG